MSASDPKCDTFHRFGRSPGTVNTASGGYHKPLQGRSFREKPNKKFSAKRSMNCRICIRAKSLLVSCSSIVPCGNADEHGVRTSLNRGIKKKRSSYPVSHKTHCRPLLPSGPGGVEHCFVAQDLTSKNRFLIEPRVKHFLKMILRAFRPSRHEVLSPSSYPDPRHGHTGQADAGADVELIGIEPTTPSLRTKCSPS